jgi:hypothetical protein
VVDRLESVLTKFSFAGEGPEWQAIWDQVHANSERTSDTLVDRCQRLAVVLQGVKDRAAMAESPRRFPTPWRADKVPGRARVPRVQPRTPDK